MNDIIDRIATLLARVGIEPEEFSPDVELADLDVDSLGLAEFGVIAEKEFGVKIADDEISPRHTVTDIAKLIMAKRAVL